MSAGAWPRRVVPGPAGVTHVEGGEEDAQQEVEEGQLRVTDPRTSFATGRVALCILYLLGSLRWRMSVKRRELSIKSGYQGQQGFLFCFFCLGREGCVRVIVMIEKGYLLQERK